jgi:hypothetical protein
VVGKGRTNEELAIEIASLGHPDPIWSVVVSSGLHGIEGFFGSAIQTGWLRTIPGRDRTKSRGQFLLIHALNPHGFATLRRVNEENMDLNRNFLLPHEQYRGVSEAYARLDRFLNPTYPPGFGDFYLVKAVWKILRLGFQPLKQAVAEGQFAYPKGLFFGGQQPAESTRIFREKIIAQIQARHVVHLDFHTGLGKSGTYKLLVPKQRSHEVGRYAEIFGAGKVEVVGQGGVAYNVRGDLGAYVTTVASDLDYNFLAPEFGTHSALRVLGALRAENQAHFFAPEGSLARQRAKAELFECFCPASPKWRALALQQGIELIQRAERLASSR